MDAKVLPLTSAAVRPLWESITPNSAMYFGHSIHTADNPDHRDQLTGERNETAQSAERAAKEFRSLTFPAGSTDAMYYLLVLPMVTSYARSISRSKETQKRGSARFEKESERLVKRTRRARVNSALLSIAWKSASIVLGVLVGLTLAVVFRPVMPEAIADRTGTIIPSIGLSTAFGLLGFWFSRWYDD